MVGILSNPFLNAEVAFLFNNYGLLHYIGQPERFWKEIEGGFLYKFWSGAISDTGKLVKSLTGIDLIGTKTAEVLADIFAREESRKVLAEKLVALQEKLRDKDRYFNCIDTTGKAILANRPPDNTLVCVEACIAYSSAILEYFRESAKQLGAPDAWFLIDGPPHLIHRDNPKIGGQFLILDFEPGFDAKYHHHAPFFPDIGWYPSVRITGYFRTPSAQTRSLPAISVAIVEYTGAKGYLEASQELASQLKRNLEPPIINSIDYTDTLTTKAWLAPVIYAEHQQVPENVPDELLPQLKKLKETLGDSMPRRPAVADFYKALP